MSVVSASDNNDTVVSVASHEISNRTDLYSNDTSYLTGKDVTSTYGSKVKFSVKVLNKNKKVLKNKLVTFKVDNKKHTSYSNLKGVASVDLNLNAGSHKITYSCDNISGSNILKVKNSYKITIYKWKSGGNVLKNKKIKANLPSSALVNKIVKSAQKGTPMIKFKGGNGKKVFITAGVHGNELSSQIAALRLIKHLQNNPIDGTVYIMPFINPKATAKNIRNLGVNLNSKANVKGTISYKTVNLITKFKCDAYGDFHCTKPGGTPGRNAVFGTYNPTPQSAKIAKFIAKDSKAKYIIYKKAATEYPGAMEDTCNLKHIPSVTCEVITPHGKIAKGSVEKSLLMMKSFLKYNNIIK